MRKWRRLRQAKQVAQQLWLGLLLGYGLLLVVTLLWPGHFADVPVTQWVQTHQHPVLYWLAQAIDEIGKPYFTLIKALLPAVLLIYYGYRREGIFLAATLLADMANQIIKILANRGRPVHGVIQVMEEAGNNGFPSGHTLNFIVYFGFCMVLLPLFTNLSRRNRNLLGSLFLLLILLSPWARVYMGMHWPSDIIGGGLLGIIFLGMLCFAYFSGHQEAEETSPGTR